jgi:hypothetical protein
MRPNQRPAEVGIPVQTRRKTGAAAVYNRQDFEGKTEVPRGGSELIFGGDEA